jgi:hypothetical protein
MRLQSRNIADQAPQDGIVATRDRRRLVGFGPVVIVEVVAARLLWPREIDEGISKTNFPTRSILNRQTERARKQERGIRERKLTKKLRR